MKYDVTLPFRSTCLVLTLCVAACGSSTESGATSGGDESGGRTASAAARSDSTAAIGPLAQFAGDNICDILPAEALQRDFGAPADLSISPSVTRRSTSCNYSWPRPDAEERKKAMVDQMMKNAMRKDGEKIKINMRALSTDFTVNITLMPARADATNFVPEKLSEEELQKRVDQANEMASKRLTDEQKKAIGKDAAREMAGRMIRKVNERTPIEGLGDAAYWLPMMGGSLNVLVGNQHVTITPNLADDNDANIEAAKKVFAAIDR